jgi:adenylate cyclase class IV
MEHSYEVEVKSLLGSPERAEEIRAAMTRIDPSVNLISRNKQLNHYFIGGDLTKLAPVAAEKLSPDAAARLSDIASKAKSSSVRTRDKDGTALLVVKASMDDTTSENGIARLEFEEKVAMTLSELDSLVLSSGYSYQAKWSREREEYVCKGINVTLDKNAGYGWLAEFERVVGSEEMLKEARLEIDALMKEIGATELPQDRLARMFEYYNKNWEKFYGTEDIFVVE